MIYYYNGRKEETERIEGKLTHEQKIVTFSSYHIAPSSVQQHHQQTTPAVVVIILTTQLSGLQPSCVLRNPSPV